MGPVGDRLVDSTNPSGIHLRISRDITRQYSSSTRAATAKTDRRDTHQIQERDRTAESETLRGLLGCYHQTN